MVSEGSGTNAKYYAQIGADTSSKKPLGRPIYLGVGTTFDLSTYPGCKNFTTDNFITGINAGTGWDSGSAQSSWGAVYLAGYTQTKNYNANTGILSLAPTSMRIYTQSGTNWYQGLTHFAYLIP